MGVAGSKDSEVLVHASSHDPLLSVVVAIYNMKENGFLEACLASLASQTTGYVEFVLCDDASTDGSLDLALSFAAGRDDVSVVHLLENRKQGTARNRGIDVARGDYIAIVDADDTVMPGYIDSVMTAISTPGVDCVFPEFIQRVDARGVPIGPPTPNVRSRGCIGVIDEARRRSLILDHGAFVVLRRDIFDEPRNRYLEGVVYEDTPTAVRWWLQVDRVEIAEGAIYCYRMNPQSTINTTAGSRRKLGERLASSDMILDVAEELGMRNTYKDEIEEYYMTVYLFNTLGMAGGCLSRKPSTCGTTRCPERRSMQATRITSGRGARRGLGHGFACGIPQ